MHPHVSLTLATRHVLPAISGDLKYSGLFYPIRDTGARLLFTPLLHSNMSPDKTLYYRSVTIIFLISEFAFLVVTVRFRGTISFTTIVVYSEIETLLINERELLILYKIKNGCNRSKAIDAGPISLIDVIVCLSGRVHSKYNIYIILLYSYYIIYISWGWFRIDAT